MNVLQKGFSTVAVILISVAIGAAAYYIWRESHYPSIPSGPPLPDTITTTETKINSEKPVDTSNWKTYRNEKYGFEVKYPAIYTVYEDSWVVASPLSQVVFITDCKTLCEREYSFVRIQVIDKTTSDLERWVRDKKWISTENQYRVIKMGYEDYKGERVYRIYTTCGVDSPRDLVLFNHGKRAYLIRYDAEECLAFAGQVLDSFKFTK